MSRKQLLQDILFNKQQNIIIVWENYSLNQENINLEKENAYLKKQNEITEKHCKSAENALLYKDKVIENYKNIINHSIEILF